jgi:hypothetical protein
VPLFSFNDAYISAVAGGDSDEDTLDLFAEAYEEMGSEVAEKLPEYMSMRWDGDGPYVRLTQEEWDAEFGTDEQPGNAAVRRSFIQSRLPAERAFVEVLHG